MPISPDATEILSNWYASLALYQDKLPSKGSIAASLVVLQRLRAQYQLDISKHVSGDNGAQITGLSAASLRKVLAQFGETRELSAIAGRSNRGARGDIAALLDAMRTLKLEQRSATRRDETLKQMQSHIVSEFVSLYFKVKRVKATYEEGSTAWRFVNGILETAKLSGKSGPVAEYLVGAKLSLKFPKKEIRNKRFSTSDSQGGFAGDFQVGTTVFHITMAPMAELYTKCRVNLDNGFRVYLLVPESLAVGTKQNADLLASNRISVESIESFIATNLDESVEFEGNKYVSGLRQFLDTYNQRVDAVELDKSLLLEIPPNLL